MKWHGLFSSILLLGLGLRADEGMWTFDNPPLGLMEQRYGFAPDGKWLEHARLSTVEFGSSSGVFISRDGLVLTNHHVALKHLEKVSEPGEKDYVKHGFVAKSRAEEIKIPDLRLYTLMRTVNVTDKVNAAVKAGMDEQQAARARTDKLLQLRDELDQKDGLLAWQISLYQGGEYWIYRYKVHRDVRLVLAPEAQIAFFGGDADNYTFPRHDMDFTLFRVYENGTPYRPAHYLKWAKDGVKEGDFTFVVGCPGKTSRNDVIAQIKYERDIALPGDLRLDEDHLSALREYSSGSPDKARKVSVEIFRTENNIKLTRGELAGLKDSAIFGSLEKREKDLRAAVAGDPRLQAEAGSSWKRIEESVEQMKPLALVRSMANSRRSRLLQTALDLVRYAQELDRPAGERLDGYRSKEDVEVAKWRLERFIPFEDMEMEAFLIAKGLEDIQSQFGPDHPFRQAVLGGRTPKDIAKDMIADTKIQFMYARTELVRKGVKGFVKSKDPLLLLARSIESHAREYDHRLESLQSIADDHGARIARARFALYGKALYPDATSSLRFSFGKVEGYQENDKAVPPFTTLGGLYEMTSRKGSEAGNGAWSLPGLWREKKNLLDPRTPLNFCHTVDICGGSSGSPVINRQGELVGVVFDGNFQSLPGRFYYDEKVNRAVSVDIRAMVEAMLKVYDARHIMDEVLPR